MCLFRGSKINQMTEQHLLGLLLYQKVAPAQVFPCELCEIFKSTFYTKHLRWLLLHEQNLEYLLERFIYLQRDLLLMTIFVGVS